MSNYIDDDEVQKIVSELRALRKDEVIEGLLDSFDETEEENRKGVKHDQGKIKLRLIFDAMAKALEEVGKVGTFGGNKYTENGWQSVEDGVNRYTDAMYRHLNKYAQGEEYDDESGLCHLSHAAWKILAVIQLLHTD